MPLLELDNGERLTEGPAIVQYIADQVPDKKLAPPNGTLRALPPAGVAELHHQRAAQGHRPALQPRVPEEDKAMAQGEAARTASTGSTRSSKASSYLMGDAFSVADAYLFTVTNWAKHVGIDISACKNLGAFMARMAARPAVQEAMKAEGLLK